MRVANTTCGALNGYSAGRFTTRPKLPPAYGVLGGPEIVTCHRCRLLSSGSAMVTPAGGSALHSASSCVFDPGVSEKKEAREERPHSDWGLVEGSKLQEYGS